MSWALQVLFSEDGYTYLDVRPRLEYEEAGRVKNSVNIPLQNAKRVWDPEQKKKVIEREDNDKFMEQVSPEAKSSRGRRKWLVGSHYGKVDRMLYLPSKGRSAIHHSKGDNL